MALFAQTVRPVGLAAIGRNVVGLTIALCVFIVLWSDASIGQPSGLDDIYTTRAVVTGKDERNRPLGFRLCFENVLVKVSGDASILSDRRLEALAAVAGQYVFAFYYRDRFEGKPVHDEQGTYDRPSFSDVPIRSTKNRWRSKYAWQEVVVRAQAAARNGTESAGPHEQRSAFQGWLLRSRYARSARQCCSALRSDGQSTECRYARSNLINIDTAESTPPDRLLRLAELSDSELPLVGDLRWSDVALGWVASWSSR
jgi:uncharacterized protein